MVRFSVLLLIVQTFWAIEISTTTAQHSNDNKLDRNRYSLQPAIDALRHRSTKLALRDYENTHHELNDGSKYIPNSLAGYDSNEPNLKKQRQINRILAKFLEKEQEEEEEANQENDPYYDDDDEFYEERKRSIFRERGADENLVTYPSVFRERGYEGDVDNNNYNDPNSYALAQEFLREIGHEREKQYRENLSRLLKKYERDEEEALEREALADEIRQNRLIAEKRRLTLPWMPASRRKRFPISKRSPVPIPHPQADLHRGTNDQVAKDLQAIFGEPDRNLTAEVEQPQLQVHSDEQILHHKVQKKSDRVQDLQDQSQHHDDSQFRKELEQDHHIHGGHSDHSNHSDHSDHDDHDNHDDGEDSQEEDDDNKYLEHDHNHERHVRKGHGHAHEEDSEEEDNSKEDESEDENDKKKTKRSTTETTTTTTSAPETASNTTAVPVLNETRILNSSNKEFVRVDQIDSSSLSDINKSKASSVERIPRRRKKSIEWSKYFGLDRKKKSVDDWFMSKHKSEQLEKSNSAKSSKTDDSNSEKIDNIEQNLKAIEDHLIEDTIKYAGAHEASSYPEDVESIKNHVVSRLATAYSLEKIRHTLEHLKHTGERNGHLEENLISELDGPTRGKHASEVSDKEKRVAVKKEKVEFDNNQHTIDSATEGHENKVSDPLHNNRFEETISNGSEDDEKTKKRKRNGGRLFLDLSEKGEDDVERDLGRHYGHSSINAYGNRFDHPYRNSNNDILDECSILNAIDKRCQNVDLITNGGTVSEFTDALLPACGVHQFCYLCGTSLTFCDFQYLSETDVICGSNKECQSTAHFVLMVLRDSTSGPQQIGPKECAKNPCLLEAMKSAAGY